MKNRYFLSNIKELQDRFNNIKIFTKLDLQNVYNLIRIKNGEKWKTVFKTKYGYYEYLVIPFGFTNAPAICQILINNVLKIYLDKTIVIYFDDILIFFLKTKSSYLIYAQKKLFVTSCIIFKIKKCDSHKKN